MIAKPTERESNHFFNKYVDLVHEDDLLKALQQNKEALIALFRTIPPAIEVFRYDANKWSIKEVLMHVIDFERYLSFKAFVSLRNDRDTTLFHPNRDHYLVNAYTETRSLTDLIPEFIAVRSATISLFDFTNIAQLTNTVNHVNTNYAISTRAIGFAIVGHSLHHMQILKERYLRLPEKNGNK